MTVVRMSFSDVASATLQMKDASLQAVPKVNPSSLSHLRIVFAKEPLISGFHSFKRISVMKCSLFLVLDRLLNILVTFIKKQTFE